MKSIWVFLTLVLLSRVNGFELLGNQTDVQLSKYFPPNTLYVPLTLIQNAAAKGALCMDGSLPGYNLHRGFGSGSNNWIVNLEGGGWCNTANDCAGRKKNGRGSSTLMAHNIPFQGILSDKSNENPDFYNWNRVKIRYCDGGSFTGDNYLPKVGVYLRGQRIYQAAIDDLMSKGLRNANQVLLSGCSAGGLATIQHCDQFAALFPRGTKVKCLADAGLFLDASDVAGGRTLRAFFNGVVRIHASSRTLSKTCTSRMDPTSCFFPQNVIPTVKTPLFLLNTAYDVWQVKESLAKVDSRWNSCKDNYATCNSNQLQFLQGFRNQMLNVVSGFSRARRNGLFINSCFAHCQSETPDMWYSNNSPRIANKNIASAVGDWFFERSETMDIDCAYPCDGTCHHLIFRKDQSLI